MDLLSTLNQLLQQGGDRAWWPAAVWPTGHHTAPGISPKRRLPISIEFF